jgi:transposase
MTLIAAVTEREVVGMQLIEGGVDASLLDNFVFHMVLQMRRQPQYQGKSMVLFMDNAVIHRHEMVLNTCRKLGVSVLFNAEYSPHLNPVEQLFGQLKSTIYGEVLNTRYQHSCVHTYRDQLVLKVIRQVDHLTEGDIKAMWRLPIRTWIRTITESHLQLGTVP